MNYEQTSKLFKALGDPNRLQIMHILQDGEKCACHLLDLLDIGQSTLSHHMKILCDSGLVSAQKEGLDERGQYSNHQPGNRTIGKSPNEDGNVGGVILQKGGRREQGEVNQRDKGSGAYQSTFDCCFLF